MSGEQVAEQQAVEGQVGSALEDVGKAAADVVEAAVQPVTFGPLEGGAKRDGDCANLDLLLDVEIPITVEVGRAELSLQEVLNLVPGSVVSLDKKAEEPVDLRVNGMLVARGEVVLVDDTYGLRITQILEPAARIGALR